MVPVLIIHALVVQHCLISIIGRRKKMIFNIPGHIEMIRNGLCFLPADNLNSPAELRIIKTQTRRLNRGIYKVGKDYAVQRKRGATGELNIRIVIDRIWEEHYRAISGGQMITQKDAWSEGGYTPIEYEDLFYKLNPKFGGQTRWVFEFHVEKC